MVSEKIFENTHTHTHTHTHIFLYTRTQQLRVVPDKKKYGGGRGLEGKALYFGGRGGSGGAVFFFVLFFQFSGQLAFVKMYNFLQVMGRLKNAVCSNGICWKEKQVPIFRRGLSRKKKMSYASAMVVVLTDKLTL